MQGDHIYNKFFIPALMYHHISPNLQSSISVGPELFKTHISVLYEAGWQTISVHTAINILNQGIPAPPKTFVVTFDDAYEDFYKYAFPILQDLGANACVYVVTDYVGRHDAWNHRADIFSKHMNWNQLRTLVSCGFEVGCHTKTHQCLVKLDDGWLHEEIIGAKVELENELGVSIDLFCYPYGRFNDRVRNKVAIHFIHAFSVEEGTFDWHMNRWEVRRIFIGPKHNPNDLLKYISRICEKPVSNLTLPNNIRKLIG